jgi:predicted nucleic acid-binding protein
LRIDREPVSLLAIDELASRHGLSANDAAYLELALRRKLLPATVDAALSKAMAANGVAPPQV